MLRRLWPAIALSSLIASPIVALTAQGAPTLEVLGAAVEQKVTGGYLGDAAQAFDTVATKLAIVNVRFPRGTEGGFKTSELTVMVRATGGTRRFECEGYAPMSGGWMFVNRKSGMSSLTFYPGGTGTIDMRLLFPVPREATEVQFSYHGAPVGGPVSLP
jgi:hypothetical protein